MIAKRLVPILNVSHLRESFIWFGRLGWVKGWEWGTPPTFGGVYSGDSEIYLCENAQVGRGRSSTKMTFGPNGDETGDKGGLDLDLGGRCGRGVSALRGTRTRCCMAPTDMPWNVQEMHVRHPDGHVFRMSQLLE